MAQTKSKSDKHAKTPLRRKPAIRSELSKSDLIDLISSETGISKGKVKEVLAAQEEAIERCLRPRGGCGIAQIGNLIKLERYKRPASKKRIGRNIRTGEEVEIPAKRSRNAVKLKRLKQLRDMV